MKNLICRRLKFMIHKNNPTDFTNQRNLGNNRVSVSWMVNVWMNNPDVSWGDTICIENNTGRFIYDPCMGIIQFKNDKK